MARSADELWVCQLGRVPYREALALQERLRAARADDLIPDTLLLLEHDPVYTRGRRTGEGELPFAASWYAERGIEIVDVKRGGRVTYHAPGQLVGYPIVRVHDVVGHVRAMERAIIAALAQARVIARSRADEGSDYTGVWVQERKIASIGVHVSRGVATHGFAINIDMDLEPWTWIVPCGLSATMTSLAVERPDAEGLACLRKRIAYVYSRELGRRQRLVTSAELKRRAHLA